MKRAAALAALVLLIVLAAPRDAMAHGSEHQGAAPAPSEAPASAAQRSGIDARIASPACPGDHGSICTCGSALACPDGKEGGLIAQSLRPVPLVVPAAALRLERVLA